jgi:hypothetical protein
MAALPLPFLQIGAMWKRRTHEHRAAFVAVIELTPELIAAAAQSGDSTVKIWCIPPDKHGSRRGQPTYSCYLERPEDVTPPEGDIEQAGAEDRPRRESRWRWWGRRETGLP